MRGHGAKSASPIIKEKIYSGSRLNLGSGTLSTVVEPPVVDLRETGSSPKVVGKQLRIGERAPSAKGGPCSHEQRRVASSRSRSLNDTIARGIPSDRS